MWKHLPNQGSIDAKFDSRSRRSRVSRYKSEAAFMKIVETGDKVEIKSTGGLNRKVWIEIPASIMEETFAEVGFDHERDDVRYLLPDSDGFVQQVNYFGNWENVWCSASVAVFGDGFDGWKISD